MFSLYVCPAEEYHLLQWKYIETFDTLQDCKDELASPSFSFFELMIAKIVKDESSLHRMFYAHGEWMSLDKGDAAYLLLKIRHYSSILEFWRQVIGPNTLVYTFNIVMPIRSLVKACIVKFCTKNNENLRNRVQLALEERPKYFLPEYMATMLLKFYNEQYISCVIDLRSILENNEEIDSDKANAYMSDFIRAQVTLPMFLTALAKKMQS